MKKMIFLILVFLSYQVCAQTDSLRITTIVPGASYVINGKATGIGLIAEETKPLHIRLVDKNSKLSDAYIFSDISKITVNGVTPIDTQEAVRLINKTFETISTDNIGNLNVAIQDQTTPVIDYYLRRDLRSLALSSTQTLSSYVVNVVSAAGVTVGNLIRIQEGDRLFQAKILSINANDLTIDTPLDYPFTTAAIVAESSIDMNVDGSVTPVIFSLGPNSNSRWDITRIIISMTHTSAADDSKFGNLTTLTKGIVIRKKDGIYHTIFNAKNNGDIRLRAYDIAYSDKAGAGLFGTSFRRSFAGQEKNGVTIRLDGSKNESFQLIIQDNLTGLSSFRAVIQGHIVED